METPKYYTPTIDEFHVGFEFEVNYGSELSSDWKKDSLLENEIVTINKKKLENIRVKYLDREDIKSLGWIHEKTAVDNFSFIFYKEKGDCLVLYCGESNQGLYIDMCKGGEHDLNFAGYCKNKSELKKLMQQLGI